MRGRDVVATITLPLLKRVGGAADCRFMRHRSVPLAMVGLLALAACSESSGAVAGNDAATITTAAPTSEETPPTTGPPESTTTSQARATTTIEVVESTVTTDAGTIPDGTVTSVPSDEGSARERSIIASTWGGSGPFHDHGGVEPDGSGCSPGTADLPDGIWYVSLTSVEDHTLAVDLMCVYSDEAAFARDDYGGGDRVYVNTSTKLRYVELGESPSFYFIVDWNDPDSQMFVPMTVLTNAISDGLADGWLLVEGGHAIEFWQPWDS
ncbi:MAG: hypothetical protein GY925_05540 [Actinomycetia bacterium]|nr:hypothetical protein [Actinomycetes bacterium]